ncbi:MAG: hypothetical protein K2F63_05950 [Muribaculaceae bacterium]|nr:hypothetical protein [Muribaculaceae bacterium]
MAEILIKVLGRALYGTLFIGLIVLVIWAIRGFGALFTQRERIKVYYDDHDHSKGYYYVRKPGGTYPVGYPKEQIGKNMEAFERLKREQKAKRRGQSDNELEHTLKKSRPMWLEILFMTPAEYMQYKRRRKKANMR